MVNHYSKYYMQLSWNIYAFVSWQNKIIKVHNIVKVCLLLSILSLTSCLLSYMLYK